MGELKYEANSRRAMASVACMGSPVSLALGGGRGAVVLGGSTLALAVAASRASNGELVEDVLERRLLGAHLEQGPPARHHRLEELRAGVAVGLALDSETGARPEGVGGPGSGCGSGCRTFGSRRFAVGARALAS